MLRFWSVISTTFLNECHRLYAVLPHNILFQVIWHQVNQIWLRRYDSRAIFLRQMSFCKMCYILFPPQAGLKQREFFIWRCPIGTMPQRCVMDASISFILSSFSKWGQLCFCLHDGTPSDEKFPLLQACLRGGGGGGEKSK